MKSISEVEVVRYASSDKEKWDRFNSESKNGTFLFYRDYMEYHGDRFQDHSLMFLDHHGKLMAIMPANQAGDVIHSHQGLTFGGIVSGFDMTTPFMLSLVSSLREYLKAVGASRLVYKAVPYIYHRAPSEEDLYALTRLGGRLFRRDVGSAIQMQSREKMPLWRVRRRTLNKALSAGLSVEQSTEFESFIELEASVLQSRHNARPVHSGEEIRRLASLFPENIKLYISKNREGKMMAAVLIFEHETVAHAQYNANSDEGKLVGASDIIYDHLIGNVYAGKKYFDFGISTEDEGRYLNEGLVLYKESLGARAVVHDFYELATTGNE